jgi:hypothetical protein
MDHVVELKCAEGDGGIMRHASEAVIECLPNLVTCGSFTYRGHPKVSGLS